MSFRILHSLESTWKWFNTQVATPSGISDRRASRSRATLSPDQFGHSTQHLSVYEMVSERALRGNYLVIAVTGPGKIRKGSVNTSNPSGRAIATSVILAASAMRTANAVGADTDTITEAPMAALFCTISTDTRLVRRMIPSLAIMVAHANAPDSLSNALWRPTSSRNARRTPCIRSERALYLEAPHFKIEMPLARSARPIRIPINTNLVETPDRHSYFGSIERSAPVLRHANF
jgi:hypothetical protein